MRISKWPEADRPREKLCKHGAAALTDTELLAIFLRSGTQGKTAVDLARELLNRFKGLKSLLSTDLDTFISAKGFGKAKFCQLQAALELGRRHLREEVIYEGHVLRNTMQTYAYLQTHLYNPNQEIFACMFLDNKNHLIQLDKLFYGTLTKASVYPREVVRAALQYNAASVILAHNHPSGNTEPSEADYTVTDLLCQALRTIEVRVLDHLIIGKEPKATVSLAERGYVFE